MLRERALARRPGNDAYQADLREGHFLAARIDGRHLSLQDKRNAALIVLGSVVMHNREFNDTVNPELEHRLHKLVDRMELPDAVRRLRR